MRRRYIDRKYKGLVDIEERGHYFKTMVEFSTKTLISPEKIQSRIKTALKQSA